jgi:hypothetical protein
LPRADSIAGFTTIASGNDWHIGCTSSFFRRVLPMSRRQARPVARAIAKARTGIEGLDVRKIVGDLSNAERTLVGFQLRSGP